ncbi:protein-methionine sulfoxide oxidase mical2b [Trichomycterus rosablanca]|uniref:protein-methionine sulfoxide oxidase mical2b n=1 Tax=Trichomycterus rosablanca TaxID=2290929 RepID=UPI002F352579
MAAVKALQQWCKIQCEGYRDVAITNMTTSFRDGLAFCALIHKYRPDLIDFDSLSKENIYENNHLAFRVAEEELGIPALLDAEDMVALRVPDRLSILTYVSQYYNYFHGRSPIGGMAGIKRPAEESINQESKKKNQPDPESGKKNQPVTAKVFGVPKADMGTKNEVLVERSNRSSTLSSSCSVCNNHVHLVQRHLVDGKLYHRNCFRCNECSNILLSGTYKPGKMPNTFVCKSHYNTQKFPATQTTQITPPARSVQTVPSVSLTPASRPADNVRFTPSLNVSTPASKPADNARSTPSFSISTPASKPADNVRFTPSLSTSTPASKPADNVRSTPSLSTSTPASKPADNVRSTPSLSTSTPASKPADNVRFTPSLSMSTPASKPADNVRSTPTITISNSAPKPADSDRSTPSFSISTPASKPADNVRSTPSFSISTPASKPADNVRSTSSLSISNSAFKPLSNIQSTPTTTISNSAPKPVSSLGKEPTLSTLSSHWLLGKKEGSFTPKPAPRYKLAPSHSETKTVKSPADQKVLSDTSKGPSSTVLRNQEARQRFFETSSDPVSTGPDTKSSTASPAAGSAGAGRGAGKGRVALRVGDCAKENNKEKENDKEKDKAKSVISKFVTDEKSQSGSPAGRFGGLRTNASTNVSPVDGANKGHTRVLLKPLDIDVELNVSPTSNKTAGWLKTKDQTLSYTQPAGNKETAAPTDWRAMLKPVSKGSKWSVSHTPFTFANFHVNLPCQFPSFSCPFCPLHLIRSAESSKDSTQTSIQNKTSETLPRPWESNASSSSSKSPSTSSLEDSTAPYRKDGESQKYSNTGSDLSHSGYSSATKPQELSKSNPDYIPREEILQELKEIERNLDELEKQGVELEKRLRQCEEAEEEDVLTNDLMVDWFNLIRSKQVYIRRESELVYIGKSQDLEEEQPNVEAELRKLLEKPDHLKTPRDRKREEELMAKLVEIVNDRNAIVDGLDEDRLREDEEDEQLKKMLQDLDIKKEKKKRSISRFFSRKSKHESGEN